MNKNTCTGPANREKMKHKILVARKERRQECVHNYDMQKKYLWDARVGEKLLQSNVGGRWSDDKSEKEMRKWAWEEKEWHKVCAIKWEIKSASVRWRRNEAAKVLMNYWQLEANALSLDSPGTVCSRKLNSNNFEFFDHMEMCVSPEPRKAVSTYRQAWELSSPSDWLTIISPWNGLTLFSHTKTAHILLE